MATGHALPLQNHSQTAPDTQDVRGDFPGRTVLIRGLDVVTELLDVRTQETVRTVPRRSWRRVVSLLLLATSLGAILWFLTPTNLGGSTTYLVTRGTSMLPTHEPGALLVTRTQDQYAVGDMIAFWNDERGHIVLHRIMGRDGGRFVTRGDNNPFVDDFRPSRSHVIGTPWIHVPHGVQVMTWLRSPTTRMVVFGALAAFAFAAVRQRRRESTRRGR